MNKQLERKEIEIKPELYTLLCVVADKTRNDIVPYYISLIRDRASDEEVIRVNQLILTKWTHRGLLYIKDKAWRFLGYDYH